VLYAGRLTADKGVHTAIQALGLLPPHVLRTLTLDIVGAGEPTYERQLQALVEQHRLGASVRFLGRVPRREMPQVFAEHDVLVFPSEWEEPFARTVLEAMAAGLVVVGTTTGGTGEVLIEGETGLTFLSGDAAALAGQLGRLVETPALLSRLSDAGRQRVMNEFTLSRMVDQFEAELLSMAQPVREAGGVVR
jgi:glycosyltransferase involved in cell wall biosynthesis